MHASAILFILILALAGSAGAAPGPAHATVAPVQRSAISVTCSKKADALGLHGKARETFRDACKRGH